MEYIKKLLVGLFTVMFVAIISEARQVSRQTQSQQNRMKRGVKLKASKRHKTKKQSGESRNEIKVVPVPGVDSDIN